jgi:hypothetical protein
MFRRQYPLAPEIIQNNVGPCIRTEEGYTLCMCRIGLFNRNVQVIVIAKLIVCVYVASKNQLVLPPTVIIKRMTIANLLPVLFAPESNTCVFS